MFVFYRPRPVAFRKPFDADRDDRISALFRHRVQSQARSTCHRTGGRHGLVDGGATGAGGIPAGSAHQAH